jgi:hypothetical protein
MCELRRWWWGRRVKREGRRRRREGGVIVRLLRLVTCVRECCVFVWFVVVWCVMVE